MNLSISSRVIASQNLLSSHSPFPSLPPFSHFSVSNLRSNALLPLRPLPSKNIYTHLCLQQHHWIISFTFTAFIFTFSLVSSSIIHLLVETDTLSCSSFSYLSLYLSFSEIDLFPVFHLLFFHPYLSFAYNHAPIKNFFSPSIPSSLPP